MTRAYCLSTLILLLASTASAQDQTPLRLAYTAILAGNVLDATSTEIALRGSGTREANPFLGQSSARRILLKSAGTAAQLWMVRKLGKSHPKLAAGVGYSLGAFFGGIAVHNWRVSP